mmetsp:Transcript_46290/g.110152  ORF Transcript_46290/g.110152 Transcript_46290/m.110152 type:complete len:346 (+) Transcript_46290:556-1593(+)
MRTLPEKKFGSCGTQAMHCRKVDKGIEDTSIPSIRTVPSVTSASLASAAKMELLPLPVRPMSPALKPPGTWKSTPRNTSGKSSLYFIRTPVISIAPEFGNSGGGSSLPSFGSGGNAAYASSLSKLAMYDSTSADWRTMNWKTPAKPIEFANANAASSTGMKSLSAALPNAATATMTTHCRSSRKPMKRFVMSHQYHARAFFSRSSMTICCIISSRWKARMHVSPFRAVKRSNTGERVIVSHRFNSVIDLTTKRRNRNMYHSISKNAGTIGGTAMQTTTKAPTAEKPKSATSCKASASCSSTLLRSPLKRFRMRPSGFDVKKASFVPSTLSRASECKDDDARSVAV